MADSVPDPVQRCVIGSKATTETIELSVESWSSLPDTHVEWRYFLGSADGGGLVWSAAMTACGRQWMLGVVKGGIGMEEGASDAEKARAKSCSAFILQSVGARDDNFYYQATFTIVSQVAGKELTSVHDKEELKRGNTRLTRYKRAYLEKESNGEL